MFTDTSAQARRWGQAESRKIGAVQILSKSNFLNSKCQIQLTKQNKGKPRIESRNQGRREYQSGLLQRMSIPVKHRMFHRMSPPYSLTKHVGSVSFLDSIVLCVYQLKSQMSSSGNQNQKCTHPVSTFNCWVWRAALIDTHVSNMATILAESINQCARQQPESCHQFVTWLFFKARPSNARGGSKARWPSTRPHQCTSLALRGWQH